MNRLVPLGGLVSITGGGTPSRKEPKFWGGSIPWATVKDLNSQELYQTQEFITEEGVKNSATNIIPAGTVITATRMGLGRAAINTVDLAINQDLKALQCDEKLYTRYLLHFLTSKAEYLESMGKGATVKGIKLEELNSLKIPLPSLFEQKRIAAILDKADAIRKKRKKAIELTETFLRSAFLEMFGDPVTNPMGWEINKLLGVCHRITDGTHQPPKWADSGIPFLFVSNIVNGQVSFDTKKFISEETWAALTERCPIELNDILYTTVGSYGNAALVDTLDKFCFQRHIAHIKPNARRVHPLFLLGMMQSPGIKRQADEQVRGVAQKTLNLRELKAFKIMIPPLEKQLKYVKVRQRAEEAAQKQKELSSHESNLFFSLEQQAFRGEL